MLTKHAKQKYCASGFLRAAPMGLTVTTDMVKTIIVVMVFYHNAYSIGTPRTVLSMLPKAWYPKIGQIKNC